MYKFQTTQETHYNRLEFIGNEGNNKSIQTTKNNYCYSHLSCSEGLLQKEFSLGSDHLSNSDMLMTKTTYKDTTTIPKNKQEGKLWFAQI